MGDGSSPLPSLDYIDLCDGGGIERKRGKFPGNCLIRQRKQKNEKIKGLLSKSA